jgi:hypothetical protein
MQPVSKFGPVVDAAKEAVTSHAIGSLGGETATGLYERAGGAGKQLVERALGEPWEATRTRLPGPAKTAEFLYGAGRAVPGLIDFAMTPVGAASLAALPMVPPPVKAGAEAYFGTEMTRGAYESGKRAIEEPTPANIGEAVGSTAMAALPVLHAGKSMRDASRAERTLAERQAAPPALEPPEPKPAPPLMNREQRRATVTPPETGVPEEVARAQTAREDIIGKPREE